MTAFEKAHEEITALARQFEKGVSHYLSASYQEAETRKDFIDKFFIALGWDVNHDRQQNPYEQEVKVEKGQRQQQSVAQKRADYAFYTAPNFKDVQFFVEAKKPSVGLRHEDYYFQTVRYGWNANTPIAVLTDFEEFHVIDCRYKPDIKNIFNGQHNEYRFTQYADKEIFAEIYWLFSREAVINNSLTKYANALTKPKGKVVQKALFKGGYQAIDDSFLAYIDGFREDIAKAFKKNNEALNSEQLTEAVQRTIDRLVFIRFLEDKLIEPENHVSEWRGWKDFIADCRKLDAKYNGVVFKKHFIDEQDFSGAEEKMFNDICSDISNLNSPYDFNYIPIHILGSIYERFLGKVVRATDKRVFIEEKPEVRKAGGVYYTPKYIVDYIVQNTVGKLIENKTPKQIAEMRFADIACGSGSFLIGVYDCLLDYHKKYYTEKLKGKTEIDGRSEDFGNVEYKDGQWILTLKLKQDILLNNIYGVDIDQQAVEVSQLSLFLKMLEEETTSSTQVKQGAFFSKVLPDLSKNIVCGNSLIGFDIMQGQLFENDELKKLNPMDYETAFPIIMRNGGFDAVVGNPPYVMLQNLEERHSFDYTLKKYKSAKYKIDTYQLFTETAINILKNKGIFGFITPNTFLKNIHSEPLRKLFLEKTALIKINLFDYGVFKGASVDTCVFIGKKDLVDYNEIQICVYKSPEVVLTENKILQNSFQNNDKLYFNLLITKGDENILEKINKKSNVLGNYFDAYFGIQTFDRNRYVSTEKVDQNYKPVIDGSNIEPYYLKKAIEYVCFKPAAIKSGGNPKVYNQDRICIRQIGITPIATFVNSDIFTLNTIYNVFAKENSQISLLFLLGCINSRVNKFHWRKFNADQKGTFPKIKKDALLKIPIPQIDFNRKEQTERYNLTITLVTQMLETKKQLPLAQTEKDKNFLENKCASIDRQIDKLVYELYGLTEDEIRIVENQK